MRWWGSKPRLRDYEREIIDHVANDGWHCTIVGAGDAGEPGFAYTVGLWETLATPELIVFGLEPMLMYDMHAGMIARLKAGEQLIDGARIGDLLRDFDCIGRAVHPTQVRIKYLNSAMWYRGYRTGDEAVEAFQLFWPGVEQNLFPWEHGCEPVVRDSQPLLFLPVAGGEA